jgi:hypothetical protein
MSEITCRRQRLTYKTPLAHLFQGDSETALCGFPKKAQDAPREWEAVPDPRPGDVCWRCVDRREQQQQTALEETECPLSS